MNGFEKGEGAVGRETILAEMEGLLALKNEYFSILRRISEMKESNAHFIKIMEGNPRIREEYEKEGGQITDINTLEREAEVIKGILDRRGVSLTQETA